MIAMFVPMAGEQCNNITSNEQGSSVGSGQTHTATGNSSAAMTFQEGHHLNGVILDISIESFERGRLYYARQCRVVESIRLQYKCVGGYAVPSQECAGSKTAADTESYSCASDPDAWRNGPGLY